LPGFIYCKPGKANRDVTTDPLDEEYAIKLIASARHKFEASAKTSSMRFDSTLSARLKKGEYYAESLEQLSPIAREHALNRSNSAQYGNNIYTYKDNSKLVEYVARG